MNTNLNTAEGVVLDVDTMADETSYKKGSWQEALAQSSTLLDRSTKARKKASALLWDGAKAGIEQWLPTAEDDVQGEGLYNEVLDILGKPRKGDASKIRTVAVAVREHGLVLDTFPNLSKAYAAAIDLTKTKAQHEAEDDAADKAIEGIDVPKSTTTVDGAAAILLSKGVDGAVVAILDALGKDNEAAHRAFLRAVSTEIAARVQAKKPKPKPKSSGPKGKAKPAGASADAAINTATAKPRKSTKAKPVAESVSKGDPNAKALPPRKATKAKPVQSDQPVETAKAQPVAVKAKPTVIKR